MTIRILRTPDVSDQTGLSRSTIYQHMLDGLFPRPINMAARAAGWIESEVQAVIAARIAGKTDAEIRELVRKLEAETGAQRGPIASTDEARAARRGKRQSPEAA